MELLPNQNDGETSHASHSVRVLFYNYGKISRRIRLYRWHAGCELVSPNGGRIWTEQAPQVKGGSLRIRSRAYRWAAGLHVKIVAADTDE